MVASPEICAIYFHYCGFWAEAGPGDRRYMSTAERVWDGPREGPGEDPGECPGEGPGKVKILRRQG